MAEGRPSGERNLDNSDKNEGDSATSLSIIDVMDDRDTFIPRTERESEESSEQEDNSEQQGELSSESDSIDGDAVLLDLNPTSLYDSSPGDSINPGDLDSLPSVLLDEEKLPGLEPASSLLDNSIASDFDYPMPALELDLSTEDTAAQNQSDELDFSPPDSDQMLPDEIAPDEIDKDNPEEVAPSADVSDLANIFTRTIAELPGADVEARLANTLARTQDKTALLQSLGFEIEKPEGANPENSVFRHPQSGLTIELDGEKSIKLARADGSFAEFDSNGSLKVAGRKDGSTVSFIRDEKSQLSEIKESSGRQWIRGEDGKFSLVSRDGPPPSEEESISIAAEPTIDSDGSFKFSTQDGSLEVSNDGSMRFADEEGRERHRILPDGSSLSFDESGRITDTTSRTGERRSYSYEGDSRRPAAIKEPDGSVWSSEDGQEWVNRETGRTRNGQVEIAEDGSQTVTNASGESHSFNIDGSIVSRDEKGRVTTIRDAMGGEKQFRRDADGNIDQYSENGRHWRRSGTEADLWVDERGNTRQMSLDVSESGIVTETRGEGADKEVIVSGRDGWQDRHSADGSVSRERLNENGDRISQGADGRITAIHYQNGKSIEIGYNREGIATSFQDLDGRSWTSTDGKSWQSVDETGGEISRNFIPELNAGGLYRESFEDGSRKLMKSDGSAITVDEQGRISQTTTSTGLTRNFAYGEDGSLSRIEYEDGRVLTKGDGDTWTYTQRRTSERQSGESEAPHPQESVQARFSLLADGSLDIRSLDNSKQTLHKLDGRTLTYLGGRLDTVKSSDGTSTKFEYDEAGQLSRLTEQNTDGSSITRNREGRVVRSVDILGRINEFDYFTDGEHAGKLKEVSLNGKRWTTADGENWLGPNGARSRDQGWVSENGEYSYLADGVLRTYQLDGNLKTTAGDGSYMLSDSKGRIIETKDARGNSRTFDYNASGQLVGMNIDGETWSRVTSGTTQLWRSQSGEHKQYAKIEVMQDGTLFTEERNGDRSYRNPDGRTEFISKARMMAAVDAIRESTYRDSWLDTGTDEDKFWGALEGKTARERQYMDQLYRDKHGHSIEAEARYEMSGSHLEKALALLHKNDGADEAGTVRVALTEMGQWVYGKSTWENERIIRDTLETMSADDIRKANQDYISRYGHSMTDAILSNPNVSNKTKAAVRILQHGHDARTPQQTHQLAGIAIENSDPNMFQEAMRRAPQSVRDYYSKGPGADSLKKTFEGSWLNAFTLGMSGYVSDTTFSHVKDYAEYGKLSVATQTRDNTSWLGDNEQAIEHAIKNMSEPERQQYRIGRYMSEGGALTGADKESFASMSMEERAKAKEFFSNTKQALEGAAGIWFSGDSQVNELAKWEDMIMHPGGSLVSKLADHRGMVYNDSTQSVLSDIENMSEADWNRLKSEPGYREQIERVLSTYLGSRDLQRANKILDGKQGAESFESSQSARRPILEAIRDNVGIYTDSENIFKAIENMTDEEISRYRENGGNNQFRRDLDRRLMYSLDYSSRKVASGMLSRVLDGTDQRPTMTILEKLNVQASYFSPDKAQIVKDVEQAFRDDPQLRDRILSPRTREDVEFARNFKDAARRSMGSYGFNRYMEPILSTGTLPLDLRQELNRGYIYHDRQSSYEDMTKASQQEASRIRTDQAYRDRVLGHLGQDERAVALNAMEQGEMRPEDKLRSHMIGFGTSEQEIKDTFAEIRNRDLPEYEGLSPAEIDERISDRLNHVKNEYARKYGEDLDSRLLAELGGSDWRDVRRQLHQRSAREEFLFAQDQAADNRSGFGSWLVDSVWDGTGFQADNDRSELARVMVMDPDSVHSFADNLYQSIDLHASSKESLANAIVDTTIAAAAVGGAFFTGGVSLSLLAYTGLAGAAFKVGAKGMVMGGDYDMASMGLLDAGSGAFEGATVFLGVGMFKAGSKAGLKAAQESLEAAGKRLVREGSEQLFEKEVQALVMNGLKSQAKGIPDDAIKELVKKFASEGSEELLEAALKQNLSNAVKEVGEQWLKSMALDIANGSVDGMVGAGGSGMIMAAGQAKDMTEFTTITATSMMFGGVGGGGMAASLRPAGWAAGRSWQGMQRILGRSGDDVGESLANAGARKISPHSGTEAPSPDIHVRRGETAVLSDGGTATLVDDSVLLVTGSGRVTAGDNSIVRVELHTASSPPELTLTANSRAEIQGPAKLRAEGTGTRVDIAPPTGSGTVNGIDLNLSGGARSTIRDGSGRVSGHGHVEISGNGSRIELDVPEGEVLRVTVKEGSPDIVVSPDSKGRIEVHLANGQEMPDGLKAFRDANPEGGRINIIEAKDLDNPLEIPRSGDARTFSPEEMSQVTARIERELRQSSESVSLAQWRELFDGVHDFGNGVKRPFTPEERLVAMEIMSQSAPNLNSRSVDAQLAKLGKSMQEGADGLKPKDKLVVYVADEISEGNALAHLFRKNTNIDIEVRVLDESQLAKLRSGIDDASNSAEALRLAETRFQELKSSGAPGAEIKEAAQQLSQLRNQSKNANIGDLPKHSIIFDDISSMSPEQRGVLGDLSLHQNLTVADLHGFSRGMNMYDFAVANMTGDSGAMNAKLVEMVQAVQGARSPGMSDEQAVSRFLSGGGASNLDGGPRLRSTTIDESVARRKDLLDSTGYNESERIEAIYRHASEPIVSQQQLRDYLGEIEARYQIAQAARRESGASPLAGTVEEYQTAALQAIDRAGHFNDYSTMARQMRSLDANIKQHLRSGNLGDSDYLIVTGLEPDGSSYLVNHLYSRATGLPQDRSISVQALKALADDPAKAQEILGGKRLVFIDDYRNSGLQQAELLRDLQDSVLSRIRSPEGQPLVKDVVMAGLARHELPAGRPHPVTTAGREHLAFVSPNGTVSGAPDGLRVHSLVGETYTGLQESMARKGLVPYSELLADLGLSSMYSQSPLQTMIVTPYGMPNNNAGFFAAAESSLRLPARYKPGNIPIFNVKGTP